MPKKAGISLVVLMFSVLLLAACRSGDTVGRPFIDVRILGNSNDQFGEPYGIAIRAGEIYVSDGERGSVANLGSEGSVSLLTSDLDTPSAIAFPPDGRLLVADSGRHSILSIDGSTTLIAGGDRQPGFADGSPTNARFHGPNGLAIAENGNIYVADTYNDRIRMIANGFVSTLAGGARGFADGSGTSAQFDTPLGLAMWGERLLVADAGNRRIRVVDPDGRVWTLSGNGNEDLVDGFPLQASFVRPTAIAVSPDGAVYVADGNAIRVIGRRSFAFVETISNDRRGFSDGNPLAARFNRPSGLAFDDDGRLLVADSDNGLVRIFDFESPERKTEAVKPKAFTPEEFRSLQPPRWPFDPPTAKRDIAGTLGEIRGDLVDSNSRVWFHNGLDIAGGYGETARFIRDEKVLDPMTAENFGSLRELLRMPTIGYIHIRLGRDNYDRTFGDPRFIFSNDASGKLNGIRVPRGARFSAGEPIGTLNAMNHVHMIAGPTGLEMNALAALALPGVSDSIHPVIESVTIFDEHWSKIETNRGSSRIRLPATSRIVARTFDRMDGNPERRRLGVYRVGYQILNEDGSARTELRWNITFDRNPPSEAVKTVYAIGSKSGYTGETFFDYIVTNSLGTDTFGEGFIDSAQFEPGLYTIRVFAADFFGNQTYKDIPVEVIK